jgi:hypothetical protein
VRSLPDDDGKQFWVTESPVQSQPMFTYTNFTFLQEKQAVNDHKLAIKLNSGATAEPKAQKCFAYDADNLHGEEELDSDDETWQLAK